LISKNTIEIIKQRIAKISVQKANHPYSDQNPEGFYLPILNSVLNNLQIRFSEDIINYFDLRLLIPVTMNFETLQILE
jgi:hypothetical protein